MTLRPSLIGFVAGLVLVLGVRESRAADQEALLRQMTAYNKNAVAAYSDGDFPKAKGQLLLAVGLAKKDPTLAEHPLMARTYIHLGVLYVDGFEDRKAGVKYFAKALKIRPDIQVSDALSTKTVKSAFQEASGEGGGSLGETAQADATESNVAEEPATEPSRGQSAKALAAEKRDAERQAREEAKASAAEKRQVEAEARDEKERLMKDLAQAGGSEAKERAAKEKLLKEKAQREELLGEAKDMLKQLQKEKQQTERQSQKEKQDLEKQAQAEHTRLQKEMTEKERLAQKEKQDLEKQGQSEKDKLQKELNQVREAEAKERAAKEKLQVEKEEKERLLAEAKGVIQQLQKEKADREKQLADTGGREKREREAKEKLEKEKQIADAHEKERKAQEESERQERERLAAGPDIPSHFSESVYCAMPDVAQAGTDLFVHCTTKVKADVIAFYYRPSGGILYNSVALQPSKKGWHATVIPADKITGKVLQYYAEARDGRGAVAGANGKAASPNILTLKPAAGGKGTRVTKR
jgi:hypothetical protein